MRESRSSYCALQRVKARKQRGTHAKHVREIASELGPVTQAERVEWAEKRLRSAIAHANAHGGRDPVWNAAVQGRRADVERERAALTRLTRSTYP